MNLDIIFDGEEEISIEQIRNKLIECCNSYYNDSISLLSDEEFDNLKDHLRKISPDDSFFYQIGSPVGEVSQWKKEKHKIPMGSLNKVNTLKEFQDWAKTTKTNDFLIMTKLDGISIDLEYKAGKLIKAITRGDGTIGEDILSNVVRMKNVKETIKGFNGSLRGEIVIHRDDFIALNIESVTNGDREYKNPRNAASGISKNFEGTYAKFCTILYYDIATEDDEEVLEIHKHIEIEKKGLLCCWYKQLTLNISIEEFDDWQDKLREEYPYDIDGMVIAVNDLERQKEMGMNYGNIDGKIAWKFKSIEKISIVTDVTWQVGLNRRITPVIHIEKTWCAGSEIEKMTCHNLDLFKSLKLYKGCKLRWKKANDIIPNPIEVVEF